MKKRPKQLVIRTLALLAVAGIVALVWLRTKSASAAPNLPTATAKQGEFRVLVRCRGTLKAARKVELVAPVDVPDLQIVWLAPPGSMVKAGDVVIRFDPSKLQQDMREKTEALKQAQASFEQAVAQEKIDADKDRLDLAQARADMEKARLEASKQAIVSAIQGEESGIDFRVAQEKVAVQLTAAALHKESNDAKIASQKRLRDQAQEELDLVKRRLAQIQVTTPIAGMATYLSNTTQGWMNTQNYKVGDHAYPGATIAEIPDLNTLEMESKVDEEDRGRIAVGDEVAVHVDALPEKTMNAKLASISLLTEQSFEEWPPLRTFRAYAAILHPDAALRPGMNAGADIVERKIENAISIPSRALFTVGGKPAVYVKRDRTFVAQPVVIEGRNPDEVAVAGIPNRTVVALLQPPEAAK
ncbi:MAG TPA: efflux RND transporter periplasmic adaptor subunit [Bryobacteraceae bacterium]|nr:efflux RND transporter periplasmic adaptor subunit [Bryobacteraceae bacterium]